MAQISEKSAVCCWTDHETAELIRVWGDDTVQSLLNNSRNNSSIYQLISDSLKEKGIERSGEQCRSKIKYLKKEYAKKRKVISESEFEGNCPSNRFFAQFHEILEKQGTVIPQDTSQPEDIFKSITSGEILELPAQDYSIVEALANNVTYSYESTIKDAVSPKKKKKESSSIKKGRRKRALENRRMSRCLNEIADKIITFETERTDKWMKFLREERELLEKERREITDQEEKICHLLLKH